MNTLFTNKSIVHNVRVEFPQLKDNLRSSVWNGQMTTLPQFTLNSSQYANGPWIQASIPAASVTFEPATVHFLMDEEWLVYEEMYKWMLGEGNYINGESEPVTPHPRDMIIHILDNKSEKILFQFKFHHTFPTILGQVDFDLSDESATYLKLPVTFSYKWLTLERNSQTIDKMKFK